MSKKPDIDVAAFSLDELQALKPQVEERIAELETQKREAVLAKIHQLAESIGETPESLFGKKKRRKRAAARSADPGAGGNGGPEVDGGAARGDAEEAPRYRHPETGDTWSGRGRRPRWVSEYLEQGGQLEQLEAGA